MTDRTAEDVVLVARARRGCAESAAALVQAYQVPVLHYAARMLARAGERARCDAEDVTQETLVRGLAVHDRAADVPESPADGAGWSRFSPAASPCLGRHRVSSNPEHHHG